MHWARRLVCRIKRWEIDGTYRHLDLLALRTCDHGRRGSRERPITLECLLSNGGTNTPDMVEILKRERCGIPWAGEGGGGYPYMIPGGGNITYGPGGGPFGSPLGSAGGG